MDAFKKQCYMKVNRAIKYFLKRKTVRRFALTVVAVKALGLEGGFLMVNKYSLYIGQIFVCCIYFVSSVRRQKKMTEREGRGVTGQSSRCAHINHFKLTLRGKRGLYLSRLNTFA